MMQRSLVGAIVARRDEIVAVVARDLATAVEAAGGGVGVLAATAVDRLLAVLVDGDGGRPANLEALRTEARAAAREGRAVGPIIDAHLSAGWAVWEVAVTVPAGGEGLSRLGGILLRAGDAAAAAIASAFADEEAVSAARGASARREFLDEVLAIHAADPVPARLLRRAPAHGLGPGAGLVVVVVSAGRDLDDDDPAVAALSTALGPRVAITATDRGRVLLIGRLRSVGTAHLAGVLHDAFGRSWTGVSIEVDAGAGIGAIGDAAREAHATVDLLVRLGIDGRVEPAAAWRLERAILTDPARLRSGVVEVLGPLLDAPRTGPALLETLRAYLETAGNRHATARRLGLAPRTVAYRLDRIEALTGSRLDGPTLIRLAAALHAAALLGDVAVSLPAPAPGRSTPGGSRRPGPRPRARA